MTDGGVDEEKRVSSGAAVPVEGVQCRVPSSTESGAVDSDKDINGPNAEFIYYAAPLVTKRELRLGFYGYEVALTSYATVVITLFLPLLLNDLASRFAVEQAGADLPPDCSSDEGLTVDCLVCIPGDGMHHLLNNGTAVTYATPKVEMGAISIDPVSYASFCISMSILSQVFAFIMFGSLADYGRYRRRLLHAASATGALACLGCAFVYSPRLYWVGGLLTVVSNTFFGLAVVYYNSYLPLLADATQRVRDARGRASMDDYHEVRDKVENTYSSYALMSGATGGVVLMGVCLGLTTALRDVLPTNLVYQIFVGGCGLWWLAVGAFAIQQFQSRPGPPLETTGCGALLLGASHFYDGLRTAWRHRHTLRMVALFFFYSDAFSTVATMGVLFAQQELCMSAMELATLSLIIPITSVLGYFCLLKTQHLLHLRSKTMLLFSLYLTAVLLLWGCLGFALPNLGLRNKWEIYLFGAVYGVSVAGVTSYSRTVYADLIPPGHEAQMFSLFQISDKGSSWLGPLVTAVIVQYTGSLRMSLVYLLIMLVLPTVLLQILVDHTQGMIDVGRIPAVASEGETESAPSSVKAVDESYRVEHTEESSDSRGNIS